MRTVEEKEAWFKQAMGCTEGDLMSMINRQVDDLSMLSMGMLSDAQELLAMAGDNDEQVRQLLNRSKYVIGKQQDRQRFLDRAKTELPKELGYVIELAQHRAEMWADMADNGELLLNEFHEPDQDELDDMKTLTCDSVDVVAHWYREVK